MVHLSPAFQMVEPYPFEELDLRVREALDAGREVIDFGVGDPREVTPAFIRQALVDGVEAVSSYPRAAGLPELRRAICGWVTRRFGVELDPDTEVLPLLGSKELVFSLAQALVDPAAGRDLVVVTAPGYPIPERGAGYVGAETVRLPLGEHGFLPELEAVSPETWGRTAILWLNYPNNPTGAVAPLDLFRRAAGLAKEHGFVLASDEAYSELWFETGPPPSVLQIGDLTNVLALNTLSKRSSMTGYRSGFAAGDPELIGALKRVRPAVGVTPQAFVQRASVAAWNDEVHVERTRAAYGQKRRVFLDLFERHRIPVAGTATFYLWVGVPDGRPSLAWALDVLDRGGLVLAPGSFFGAEGEGRVRIALVPTLEDCEKAAAILDDLLEQGPRS
jgi:succinyldiaminopimelate transaminase